jgi:hypothetical protein
MEEKRESRRINLVDPPLIYDAHSDKLLGTMVDISAGGFKIITYNKMEQGQDYLLRINLPEESGDGRNVVVKVNVKWCNSGLNKFFIAGCSITEIEATGRLELSTLMIKGATKSKGGII